MSHALGQFLLDGEAPWGVEGCAFGNRSVVLRFGGATYVFEGLNDTLRDTVVRRYGPFVGEPRGRESPLVLRIRKATPEWFREVDTRGLDYQVAIEHGPRAVRVAGLTFASEMDRATLGTTIHLHPDRVDGAVDGFENTWRAVVAHETLKRGGVMFHSAGVIMDNRAVVLFGESGVGKSTFCRHASELGYPVLSDELNALVPDPEERFFVHPMPFAGDFGPGDALASVPLMGVFRLAQGSRCDVQPTSRARAFASLWSACPIVNTDALVETLLTRNLERLMQHFDVHRFVCTAGNEAVRAIHSAVASGG